MPKAERGTPKDIANRMKSKGLQKLKFYCQMCSKQCRDENGFKCHLTSESHLRQIRIFANNSHSMLDNFSSDFEKMYIQTLRRRHGTKRMNANNVYQEVIHDKHHIHMNSTKWTTLSDFVQYLGKTSKCIVEETERGWYVTYISRDPIMLQKQQAAARKAEADKMQEERVKKQMEIQRKEAAKELDRIGGNIHVEPTKLGKRKEGEGKLELALNINKASKKRKLGSKSVFDDDDDDDDDGDDQEDQIEKNNEKNKQQKKQDTKKSQPIMNGIAIDKKISSKSSNDVSSKPKSFSSAKGKKNRKPYWLHTGIFVKIISKSVGKGKYYKRKAIVDKIIDKYAAEVEIIASSSDANDGGDILQLDQDDLETVIPRSVGKKCRILNGEGRGSLATLIKFDERKSRADLQLLDGDERIIRKVDYDDFSKAE